jgi:hypothetical protein
LIAAVHITKGITWHGHVEEFENVWHYDTPTITTDAGWDELIDAVVAAEKLVFPPGVSWLRARVHGPTDTTEADDIMRRVKDLTGVGSGTTSFVLPPELAVVASFYMGRSSRGFKIFLRKYLHGVSITGTGAAIGHTTGVSALGANQKAAFTTLMNTCKTVTIGAGVNNLCTPKGLHIPAGTSPVIADYVATRQFKRGRKERV